MTPQYRIEQYLNAISAAYLGDSPLPEYPSEPVWRIEQFLAAILSAVKGDSPVMACPEPVWHIEEFARAIYDALTGASPAWPCPTATNNIEAILHAIYKVVVDGTETDGIAASWDIERWLLDSYDAAKQGGGTETTLSGNLPLVLANAISHAIVSLTRYGLCAQASTPAPNAPVDIMCNNGTLKWDSVNQRVYADGTPEVLTVGGKNLLNAATNITGYYISSSGSISAGSDSQYTDLVPVTAGETYVCSLITQRTANGTNRLHGYDSNGDWVQQLAYAQGNIGQGKLFSMSATIPAGVEYVRLSYGQNDENAMIICAKPYMLDFYETKSYSGTPYIEAITKIQSPYTGNNRPGLLFDVTPGTSYMIVDDCKRNNTKVADGVVYVSFYRSIEDATNRNNALSNTTGRVFTAPAEAGIAVVNYNAGSGTEYSYTFSYAAIISSEYAPYVSTQTASVPMLLSVGDVKDEVELIRGPATRRCAACLYDGTQPVGDVFMSTTGGKDIGSIIVYPLATPFTEQTTEHHLNAIEGTTIVDATAKVGPLSAEVKYVAASAQEVLSKLLGMKVTKKDISTQNAEEMIDIITGEDKR